MIQSLSIPLQWTLQFQALGNQEILYSLHTLTSPDQKYSLSYYDSFIFNNAYADTLVIYHLKQFNCHQYSF